MAIKQRFIPTFFHGDHGASSIAGAYLRGINQFDIKGTYQLLLKNANIEGGTRPYISEYIRKGYIAEPDIASPKVETKAKAVFLKRLNMSMTIIQLLNYLKRWAIPITEF